MKPHHPKIFFTTCLCLFLAVNGLAISYEVQKGDNLSAIAHKNIPGPIYGDHGSLRKVLSHNPQIANPDFILPGTFIEIPDNLLETRGLASNEVLGEEANISESGLNDSDKESQPATITPIFEASPTTSKVFEPYSSFGLYPLFGFSRLESSQSGTASALSKLGTGAKMDWTQYWSNSFASQIYFNHQSYEFEIDQNSILRGSSTSISEFGFGISKNFDSGFIIQGKLGYKSSPFLRAISQNTLQLESVQAGIIHLSPAYEALSVKDLSLLLGLPLSYEFAGNGPNINTDGGIGYGLSLELRQSTTWGELNAGAIYLSGTNAFNQAETINLELITHLGIRLNIGEKVND